MNIKKVAEDIAGDWQCAGGQFNERVVAIMPYLRELDKIATGAGWISFFYGTITGAAICFILTGLAHGSPP